MSLQDAVEDFLAARGPLSAWRVISMLTEEAGEVQGAFNKWQDGNKRKPKTEADVVEELVQLAGCCFIAGQYYGFDVEELEAKATSFLREKITQIRVDGWTPEDQISMRP